MMIHAMPLKRLLLRASAPILVLLSALVPWTFALSADSALGEQLEYALPAGYVIGFRHEDAGTSLNEAVLRGESVNRWSTLITVQTFPAAKFPRPGLFLIDFSEGYARACPALTHTSILNGQVNGYATSFLALRCPLLGAVNKPENVYIRAIRGAKRFYVVQVALRHPVSAAETAWIERFLRSAVVCDSSDNEHACS